MYISGTVPFGYVRAGKGQLAIKPGEADMVARIFNMALTNAIASASTVARQLNQEGVPGPIGNKWWSSAVERILRNPLYVGTVVYRKRSIPRCVPGGEGKYELWGDALAEVENAVPAIISKELFAKVTPSGATEGRQASWN